MATHRTPVPHARSDQQLIELWLYGRSANTQDAYRRDIARFCASCGKPLRLVTLGDLQRFADSLTNLAPASRTRVLNAVKSLLTFGAETGYLAVNVGAAFKHDGGLEDHLSERMLSEAEVQRMIAREEDPRNRALLLLLYGAGLRVSELCGLTWRDLRERPDLQATGMAGQVKVFGKGNKTRVVLLSREVWREVQALRADASPDDPVFRSRKGGAALTRVQVFRIVKAAAERARVVPGAAVSPHWLRHAHASHALKRGAPLSLVRDTLGHANVMTTNRYLQAEPDASSSQYLGV